MGGASEESRAFARPAHNSDGHGRSRRRRVDGLSPHPSRVGLDTAVAGRADHLPDAGARAWRPRLGREGSTAPTRRVADRLLRPAPTTRDVSATWSPSRIARVCAPRR